MSNVIRRRWQDDLGSGLSRKDRRSCECEAYVAADNAIDRLVDAGILRQVKVGRRNRAFEAPDVIAAFTDLERQLASPSGDTRVSSPARALPRRK